MLNPFAAMEIISIINISIILITILSKWNKTTISTKLFALNIALIIIGTACDAIEINSRSLSVQADTALLFVTLLIGNSLSISFSYYSMYQANVKERLISPWIPRIVLIANGLSMLALTVSFITGTLFTSSIDKSDLGFAIYYMLVTELATTIFLLTVLTVYRKKIGTKVFISLFILICAPIVGMSIEFITDAFIGYSTLSISILIQYVLIQSKIVSEAEMRHRIESEVSRTDVMTGLQNRRSYTEFLDSFTAPVCCGAMFFDVNGLKRTNDSQGHIAGDNLIRTFSDLLRANLPNAKLYRISGDEFVALYDGADKKELFEKEIAAISAAIKSHDSLASMGTSFNESNEILKTITEAEKNMYVDKQDYYLRSGFDRRKSE